jgi:hypothetical protein
MAQHMCHNNRFHRENSFDLLTLAKPVRDVRWKQSVLAVHKPIQEPVEGLPKAC